jgi:CBS domain containing-hemolysin-like protein
MTMGLIIVFLFLMALQVIVSYTARLYSESGKFLSREFQENIEIFEQQVEPRLRISHWRAALSMAVLEQITTAAFTLLVAWRLFENPNWEKTELFPVVFIIVLYILIFNRFIPYLLFSRTRGEWFLGLTPIVRVLIYLAMPLTLVLGFLQSIVSLTRAENTDEQPEHPSEAVDALIEAGQDEGILEESDRDLIHSVVEFGDKVVREVMTPRPNIVGVPTTTTIEELTTILNEHPYSRLPVFEGDIDHIVGIVFVRDLLQVPDTEARSRTVRELMKPDVYFVPETRRASELLQEMQRENIRMAVVIDEYGGVAGVVTTEDLVEEIVGELRDERESKKDDIVRENENTYVVPGNMDIDRLDEFFGIRLSEYESTTISGLVTEVAGHIPLPGEVVEEDGLRFEILESTNRRVERVRVINKTAEPRTIHKGGE